MSTSTDLVNSGNPSNYRFIQGSPATSGDPETIFTNSGYGQLGGLTNTDDNGLFSITTPKQDGPRTAHPPTGTGSATVFQPFGSEHPDSGFSFKLVVVSLSDLQNTSNTKYTLNLPSPFLLNYMILTSQCPSLELLNNGQPAEFNRASGVGSGNLGVYELGQFDWASGIGAIDSIRFGTNDAQVNNGVIVIIGV